MDLTNPLFPSHDHAGPVGTAIDIASKIIPIFAKSGVDVGKAKAFVDQAVNVKRRIGQVQKVLNAQPKTRKRRQQAPISEPQPFTQQGFNTAMTNAVMGDDMDFLDNLDVVV